MESETDGSMSEKFSAGTGQVELFSVVLSMLCSSLIHHWLTTRYSYIYLFGGTIALFSVEFLSMCLPPLLIHTYFGNHVVLATILLLTICFLLCSSTRSLRVLRTSIFREFKVTILVSTCLVICAVDCKKIFTPQFAKTQAYGFSPMDLGTGLFVAVRALDSLRRDLRRANEFHTEIRPTKARSKYIDFNEEPQMTRRSKDEKQPRNFQYPRFLPFLLIGLARIAFVEFSGYYQDPTEYGTHWNFLITLAFIELFISLFHLIFRNDLAVPVVSVLIGLAYFAVLSATDFEAYLLGLETERVGLLDGNREGICSTFGYLFIFGLTYLVARFFVPTVVWDDMYTRHAEHQNLSLDLSRNLVVQILIYMAALLYFGLPSRRIANLTYGLHIHTVVTIIVFFMHIYMHCVGKRLPTASLTFQLPTLHSAISRHGAFFFLTANLLTGFLNFCRGYIQTPELEFASLLVYMLVLCLSVKFWNSGC